SGQSTSFTDILADALTIRGIQKVNVLRDIAGAESDLRRAFELKPFSMYIRHQFVVAKRQLALYEESKDTTKRILEEARQIAIEGLKEDAEHEGLREELEEIKNLLEGLEFLANIESLEL